LKTGHFARLLLITDKNRKPPFTWNQELIAVPDSLIAQNTYSEQFGAENARFTDSFPPQLPRFPTRRESAVVDPPFLSFDDIERRFSVIQLPWLWASAAG
jgi:hypothetical protein